MRADAPRKPAQAAGFGRRHTQARGNFAIARRACGNRKCADMSLFSPGRPGCLDTWGAVLVGSRP